MRYSFHLACLLFILASCNNSANQESTTVDSSALVKPKKPARHSSDQQGLTFQQLNHLCITHGPQEDHGHKVNQEITAYMGDDPVPVSIEYLCSNKQTKIPAAYNTTIKPAGDKYLSNYQAHIVIDIPGQHKIDVTINRDSFKTAVRDEIWKYGTIADVPLFEGYDDGSKSFKFSFLLSLPTMDSTYRQFAELSVTSDGKISATKVDTIPEVQEE